MTQATAFKPRHVTPGWSFHPAWDETLRRSWVNYGRGHDWTRTNASAFLEAATEVKTVWVPYGEG